MTKVLIIGDCHTARIWSHHIIANTDKNFVKLSVWRDDRTIQDTKISLSMWGLSGLKAWNIDYMKHLENQTFSSVAEDLPMWSPVVDNITNTFSFSDVYNSDVIMPWIGYIDSRNFLPKYENAEEVATKYFYETLKFFNKSKIRFIEPFPQFETLGTFNYHESYRYEERSAQADIFIKTIRDLSAKNGLIEPVGQQMVYDAIGDDRLRKRFAKQGFEYHNYTLLDGLRAEENKKIYDMLIPEVLYTANTLINS